MRRGHTRSHSELGSQALQRRWYFALRYGRVGRCQAWQISVHSFHEKYFSCHWRGRFYWIKFNSAIIKKTKYKIISIDNYSSGSKQNHIRNKRVTYINSNTTNIDSVLKGYRKKINAIFHFGEFARIYQSFLKFMQYKKRLIDNSKYF